LGRHGAIVIQNHRGTSSKGACSLNQMTQDERRVALKAFTEAMAPADEASKWESCLCAPEVWDAALSLLEKHCFLTQCQVSTELSSLAQVGSQLQTCEAPVDPMQRNATAAVSSGNNLGSLAEISPDADDADDDIPAIRSIQVGSEPQTIESPGDIPQSNVRATASSNKNLESMSKMSHDADDTIPASRSIDAQGRQNIQEKDMHHSWEQIDFSTWRLRVFGYARAERWKWMCRMISCVWFHRMMQRLVDASCWRSTW